MFRDYPGIESLSAGTSIHAPVRLSKELVASVDLIFAMEAHHRERIRKKFKRRPGDDRIITLHIPDEYERDDPVLIEMLKQKAEPVIRRFLDQIALTGI